VFVSLTTFSQKNIKITTNDSVVILPKNVAIQVVKDLIRKDSLESELVICKDNNKLLESNSKSKDSIINNKETRIQLYKQSEINFNTTIALKDEQLSKLNLLVKDLNREIKGYKIKSALKRGGNYLVYGALIFTIIKLAK